MSQTIEARVSDYIGTTDSSGALEVLADVIPSINDIAEKAIFDMMKSLPAELAEPYALLGDETTNTGKLPAPPLNSHVYSVYIGNIPVIYAPPSSFAKANDTGNYAPTALDPIYTIKKNGTDTEILVLPDANHDYYYIQSSEVLVVSDKLGANATNDLTFVPLVAHEAIILDICIKGLQAKLSDLAQDEEDPEMFQVLTAQIQQLQTSYQFELAKILGPPKEAK